MITHQKIYDQISILAPFEYAEEWDPTGKMLGDFSDKTRGIVVSLDLTYKSLEIALENNCNLIITHHPFLFSPVSTVLAENKEQKLLLELAKNQISCFSCHTNLDVASKGVAMSFLEMALKGVLFDSQIEIVFPLEDQVEAGHCRMVNLINSINLSELQNIIDTNLKTVCQINTDQDQSINKIVFAPGSFTESWISSLENKNIDLLVTGELKHHASVMLHERNIATLATGHGASEQTIIPFLSEYLKEKFENLTIVENEGIIYNYLRSE